MCIFISSTSHPEYPFLALSNRDEYFGRPTQLANVRDLESGGKIISPLDLGRIEHGSWIGITSTGKLAVLVNYCEPNATISEVSRGVLPIEYLTSDLDDEAWYDSLEETLGAKVAVEKQKVLNRIGGFTLVYGKLEFDPETKQIHPLNIISNRGDRGKIHAGCDLSGDLHKLVALQKTFAVSNSLYYEPWEKVQLGCRSLSDLIKGSVASDYSHEQLVEGCFEVLSRNTLSDASVEDRPKLPENIAELQNSIFIPPIKCKKTDGAPILYGTRTQTVVLLHKSGTLHYYERDLHSIDDAKIEMKNQHYQFDLNKK